MRQQVTHRCGRIRIFGQIAVYRRIKFDFAFAGEEQNRGRGDGLGQRATIRRRLRCELSPLERIGPTVSARKTHAFAPPNHYRATELLLDDQLVERLMQPSRLCRSGGAERVWHCLES